MTVVVRDAETETPIVGAAVELRYLYFMTSNPPEPVSAVTDADGRVAVRVATFDAREWTIAAAGYVTAEHRSVGKFPAKETFRLYKEPIPHVTIAVPNGYRGPVKIETYFVAGWIQERAGARAFTYHASPAGFVQIEATPLSQDSGT